MEQWAPLLREEGVELTFAPFLSHREMAALYRPGHIWTKVHGTLAGYLRRFAEVRRTSGYDVMYVYREGGLLAPAWLERRLCHGLPLVYDFDDAIYLPAASGANGWAAFVKSRRKVAVLCGMARHVTVGNEILASFARSASRSVTVIPSTVDTNVYTVGPRRQNLLPVVGWTGSATTVPHRHTCGRWRLR
jgi:hypothetical protein